MQQRRFPSELVKRYMELPEEWRPFTYSGFATMETALSGRETVAISLSKQPFILESVRTRIVGLADESGKPINDGLYTVEMQDEISNYTSGGVPASLFHGGFEGQTWESLPYPVFFGGNNVLSFTFQNLVARSNPPSEKFKIYVALLGFMHWGVEKA